PRDVRRRPPGGLGGRPAHRGPPGPPGPRDPRPSPEGRPMSLKARLARLESRLATRPDLSAAADRSEQLRRLLEDPVARELLCDLDARRAARPPVEEAGPEGPTGPDPDDPTILALERRLRARLAELGLDPAGL